MFPKCSFFFNNIVSVCACSGISITKSLRVLHVYVYSDLYMKFCLPLFSFFHCFFDLVVMLVLMSMCRNMFLEGKDLREVKSVCVCPRNKSTFRVTGRIGGLFCTLMVVMTCLYVLQISLFSMVCLLKTMFNFCRTH